MNDDWTTTPTGPALSPVYRDTLHPTTTAEQDRKSLGQRQINRVWEYTQAVIAVSVTMSTLYAAVFIREIDKGQFLFLTNTLFVVIGFYFGRTNHQRTGGVGGDSAGNR